jgi:hypothetical protein
MYFIFSLHHSAYVCTLERTGNVFGRVVHNDPNVTDSNDNKAHYTRTMVFIVHPKPRRDLQTVLQGEANTIPLLFLIDCKSRFIIGLVDIDIAQ